MIRSLHQFASIAVLLATGAAMLSGCGSADRKTAESVPVEFDGVEPHAHRADAVDRSSSRDVADGLLEGAVAASSLPPGAAADTESSKLVAGKNAPTYVAPFPDRTNPFEFAGDVAFDSPQAADNAAVELKLYGFVGSENPRAAINAGGRTRLMSSGEKWGVIELLEIKPPEVRIRIDGVVRTWSLLGRPNVPSG